MISPGRYDISADRWVACFRTFSFVGKDFTGATFLSDVRLKNDLTGTPLVHLTTVASGAEGIHLGGVYTDTIANHIAAGRLSEVPPGFALTTVVPLSVVEYRINESTMRGLPPAAEIGLDATLAWDLLVTPSGGLKDKYIGGQFIVRAGATQ